MGWLAFTLRTDELAKLVRHQGARGRAGLPFLLASKALRRVVLAPLAVIDSISVVQDSKAEVSVQLSSLLSRNRSANICLFACQLRLRRVFRPTLGAASGVVKFT